MTLMFFKPMYQMVFIRSLWAKKKANVRMVSLVGVLKYFQFISERRIIVL